jgi:hypothetical protein
VYLLALPAQFTHSPFHPFIPFIPFVGRLFVRSEKPVLTPMSLRLLELLGVIVIFQLLFTAFFLLTHRWGRIFSTS